MMDKSNSELSSKGENLLRLDTKTPYKTTLDWEKNYRIFTPAYCVKETFNYDI